MLSPFGPTSTSSLDVKAGSALRHRVPRRASASVAVYG